MTHNKVNDLTMDDYQLYIHKSRYARYDDSKQRRENWDETVQRLINFYKGKFPEVGHVLENEIQPAIKSTHVVPSMRSLMTAGPALERDNLAGYNCLSGDTLVTTLEYGIVPIEQLVEKSVHVVDGNGEWTLSKCYNYGPQKLYKIKFAISGHGDFEIRATENHRWIMKNGEEKITKHLISGDRVATVEMPTSPSIHEESEDYKNDILIEVIDVVVDNADAEVYCDVYCFEVPTTHSFLLTKNLLTGNCSYITINSIKAFSEALYILMNGCFAGNTLVQTKTGHVEIAKLTTDHEVFSYNFSNEKYEYIKPDIVSPIPGSIGKPKLELIFDDNSIVRCTENHEFYTITRGWVSAKDLTEDDPIQYCSGTGSFILKLLVKTELPEELQNVYWDLVIPKTHNYVLGNGALVHNCGLGFSVERQYIAELPVVADEFYDTDTTIVVKDSKLGWSTAYHELISLLYQGKVPKFDVSKVRPAGARLKVFGGRASGPLPLLELFEFTSAMFKRAAGRKLTSIECHDIMCKIGEVVVVGGVRRSAMISLSNLSDSRMSVAKTGKWWEDNVQRSLANNSVAYTEKPEVGTFMKEWLALYDSKSGERGIFNRVSAIKQAKATGRREYEGYDFGVNPCAEIILRPNELCNLSEVIIRNGDTLEQLKEKVRLATIIGTLQSTLTDFKYVRHAWKRNCEEERLLGVSLTGIMDHDVLSGKSGHDLLIKWLTEMKDCAIQTNAEWADKLGINRSAAITTVKPSGCTTLDTIVKTEHGDMSMKEIFDELSNVPYLEQDSDTWIDLMHDLKVYDENNELKRITKLYVNGMSDVFIVGDCKGHQYKFTGNHKLKTSRGWVRVDELMINDTIVGFTEEYNPISVIFRVPDQLFTVDIEVDDTHSYQLGNGWVSHNTVSQLVNSASGIHPRYSKYYIRTVRQDKKDPLGQFLKNAGVPCEDDVTKPDSTWVFSFPQQSPDTAVFRNDMNAIDQLEHYLIFKKYWCEHNPSITVYVREDDWFKVGAWVYEHFDDIGGVSFLPHSDHAYRQAPYQELVDKVVDGRVVTAKEQYDTLVSVMPKIDWSAFVESTDNSEGAQTLACMGAGGCDIL